MSAPAFFSGGRCLSGMDPSGNVINLITLSSRLLLSGSVLVSGLSMEDYAVHGMKWRLWVEVNPEALLRILCLVNVQTLLLDESCLNGSEMPS